MKFANTLAAALILAGTAAAWADETPVARIDGAELSVADVQTLLQSLDPSVRAKATADHRVLESVIRAELGRRAVLDAARQAKWEQRPDVQQKLARAHDDALIGSFVSANAALPAGFPSDQEVKQTYDANLSRFMLPRQYHLAQIFVATKDGTSAEAARAKADDLAKKAKLPGADFAQLAKTASEDKGTAASGGDLGWLPENQLIPEIAPIVRGMTDREVSGAVQTPDGWHIVQLLGTKPPGPAPFDEVKATIVSSLRQQRAIHDADAYVEKLLQERHAAVNEMALEKIAPAEKPAAH